MKTFTSLALVVFAAACSADQAGDGAPPTLEILTPERGGFGADGEVTVTGTVRDNGAVRVTINGADVEVGSDGSFATTLDVEPGITILETHAIDGSGNDVRDVRAVLAGTLAPTDGTTSSKLGAHLGPEGLATIGNALATTAEGIDFTAAATALNPVYQDGGCLGATINITSVEVGNIDVALAAQPGSLGTTVAIDNFVVRMRANFKVACIGGSTNITVRTSKATLNDDLGIALLGGQLKTSLPSPTVSLEGFSVDVGGVPGAIESLLKGKAREAAEKAIVSTLKSKVPPMADTQLAALIARPLDTALLGHDLAISVAATSLDLSDNGLFIAADTKLLIAGGEGGTFVTQPMPISGVTPDGPDLGIVIANDLVNQLFASLWAAGAFDMSLSAEAAGPVAALLDDDVRTLDISLSLPPTVTTRAALELAIGDLIITGRDASGVEVQKFALSLQTTLAATPGGDRLTLATTTPTVYAQLLAQSELVDNPLEATQLEGIVTGVWGLVDGMINDALVKLPMPSLAGITLEAPAVTGRAGYLVVDAGLR